MTDSTDLKPSASESPAKEMSEPHLKWSAVRVREYSQLPNEQLNEPLTAQPSRGCSVQEWFKKKTKRRICPNGYLWSDKLCHLVIVFFFLSFF